MEEEDEENDNAQNEDDLDLFPGGLELPAPRNERNDFAFAISLQAVFLLEIIDQIPDLIHFFFPLFVSRLSLHESWSGSIQEKDGNLDTIPPAVIGPRPSLQKLFLFFALFSYFG